jgi:hypothetical protein
MRSACRIPRLLAAPAAAAMLLLAAHTAAGQVVHGRVVIDGTETPIDMVAIELVDSAGQPRATATSDSVGGFSLRAPLPGSYTLRLTHIGYTAVETGAVTVARGETIELELRMSIAVVPLEALRVVGRSEYLPGRLRNFYDRADYSRRTGLGRVFMRSDVLRFPQPSAILAQLPQRAGCRATIMLDGLPVGNARELDSIISTDALEGVEFYTGSVQMPMEYAHRGFCAVALFWSRHDIEDARPLTWRRVLLAAGMVIIGVVLVRM